MSAILPIPVRRTSGGVVTVFALLIGVALALSPISVLLKGVAIVAGVVVGLTVLVRLNIGRTSNVEKWARRVSPSYRAYSDRSIAKKHAADDARRRELRKLMARIEFRCPQCENAFIAGLSGSSRRVGCPACRVHLRVSLERTSA
jgi:hypothetical protein